MDIGLVIGTYAAAAFLWIVILLLWLKPAFEKRDLRGLLVSCFTLAVFSGLCRLVLPYVQDGWLGAVSFIGTFFPIIIASVALVGVTLKQLVLQKRPGFLLAAVLAASAPLLGFIPYNS